jgi:CubicO group peptidase (beta-lactamase class C family)
VGQWLLQQGRWDGRALVPADWIAQSLTPRADAFDGLRYRHHWYVAERAADRAPVALAIGNGGQRLLVLPRDALACVVLAGNYNRPDQAQVPLAVQRLVAQAWP